MKTILLGLSALSPALFAAKAFDAPPVSDLLVKASHVELEVKAEGDDGVITGYGSIWNAVDSYGETVVKGAFKESLREWKKRKRPIPMLWQHRSDQPIGGWHEFEEDDTGLKLSGKLNLETQRGKEAWSDVRAQNVGGLSIGYYEIEADPYTYGRPADEPRKLKKLDLRETSVVTFPALREAQIDAVKARLARGERLTLREFEGLLREKLLLSRTDAEEIASLGYKTWLQRDAGDTGATTEDDDAAALVREIRSGLGDFVLPAI